MDNNHKQMQQLIAARYLLEAKMQLEQVKQKMNKEISKIEKRYSWQIKSLEKQIERQQDLFDCHSTNPNA